MELSLSTQAFIIGLISAVSLPLGAIVALVWSPGNRVIAGMMAFGSGALLAALTIDLVGEALERGDFVPLAIGCLAGGLLFVTLNQALNSRGGFLRKVGTTMNHLRRVQRREYRQIFKQLSQSPLFSALPAEHIHHLVPLIEQQVFDENEILMSKGETGGCAYLIDSGHVEVDDVANNKIAELGPGEIVGEIALVSGEVRTATVRAMDTVSAWVIQKHEFDELLEDVPAFARALNELSKSRITALKRDEDVSDSEAKDWYREVRHRVDDAIGVPTATDVREAAASIQSAPMAIWLGIFLDGIPESFVIGSSMLHSSISLSLIAGLFLSNFPEAFSSSQGMKEQGYSATRIIAMWTSLMLFTGIGAWLGNIFFEAANPETFSLVQGVAAGAMLTVIAETMLPEAHNRGGGITGLATLLGFLVAIYFSTLS